MSSREQNGHAQSLPPKKRVLVSSQQATIAERQPENNMTATQKITQVPVVVRTQSMATPIVMASYPVQSTSCIPTMYIPMPIQGNHQTTVQYGAATYQTASQPVVKVQTVQYSPQKPVVTNGITHAIKMAPKRTNAVPEAQKTVTYITGHNIGQRVEAPKQQIVMASPKMTTGFIRAVQPPQNIQRSIKLDSGASCVPDVKIDTQAPIKYYQLKKPNQNFVPVQQPEVSNTSLSMPESTDCFFKGSTITLENGECKKIEDLNQDDFVKCAQVTTDKKLIRSVLTEMTEMKMKSAMVSLHFRVQVTGQNVIVEAPTNYPYFTKDGWASVDPLATERSYRLKCRKLAKGDEIFSIEKESSDEQESQFIPVSSSVSSSQPQKKSIIETTFGSGGAFRPIHEKPMSEYRANFPTITSNTLQSCNSHAPLEQDCSERNFFRNRLDSRGKKLRKRRASDSDIRRERRSESR
ncbi:Oidioi.mRNA.OKI2018_I69.XSR.g14632.t1.cds [Oikopleura dioica]|uniref:Oidioi.mRNA.OKI2018_I69.XSR.g14632.t1.cds n=1 Tax=Oikopleura dioica TaxID=34765 RepID=A0ABN7SFF3_OIKDI|nr:Oidioi.mRNA.OKI2018_I69.XSR.g14632.t1.cds [Oikopleura dioica]